MEWSTVAKHAEKYEVVLLRKDDGRWYAIISGERVSTDADGTTRGDAVAHAFHLADAGIDAGLIAENGE